MPIPGAPHSKGNNFGIARLILAALVVLAHSPELIDGNRLREPLIRIFGTLTFGELAVDGFFLISGYLILASWEQSASALDYLAKRVLRIYPGFIVAFLISLLLVGPISGGHLAGLAGQEGLMQAARLLLLRGPQLQGAFPGLHDPQLNSSMWTIAYEFRCYLLTMALGSLGLFRRPAAACCFVAVLLALLFAAPFITYTLPLPLTALTGTIDDDIRFLTMFYCGGLFYVLRDRIRYDGRIALLALLGTAAAMFVHALAEPALALLGAYALFWFIFRARSALLTRINGRFDMSYGLYLYAWPVQNLIISRDPAISPWLLTLLATLLAALLGAASWVLVERPCMALRRRFMRA